MTKKANRTSSARLRKRAEKAAGKNIARPEIIKNVRRSIEKNRKLLELLAGEK